MEKRINRIGKKENVTKGEKGQGREIERRVRRKTKEKRKRREKKKYSDKRSEGRRERDKGNSGGGD